MQLTKKQKIALLVVVCNLAPAYLIANWRHDANLAPIQERLERAQDLNQSTSKLLLNCEKNSKKEDSNYDANHQICAQGVKVHEQTQHEMTLLTEQKETNDQKWYLNLLLSWLLLLVFEYLLYRGNQYLNREVA